jgi:hypothetical protein
MDPLACLRNIEDTINAHEECEGFEWIRDYYEWRRKGGFEPTGIIPNHLADKTPRDGDLFHAMLITWYGLTFGADALKEVIRYKLV